jgi:hypothetical protein
VEHDVQLLPFAPLGARRPATSRDNVSLQLMATPEVGRAALLDHGIGLEQHDEHGGRLVLPDD